MTKMRKKGQAMLEIAVFGAIILTIFGVILQYGLKYGFQQRTMMSSFRRALRDSGRLYAGGSGSYTLLRDRHIPDPAGMGGAGQVVPSVASGSVTRTYRMNETPDYDWELPQTTLAIESNSARAQTFRTADFAWETISREQYPKYQEVYGDGNVKDASTNGDPFPPDSANSSAYVRIMDSCLSQLPSYDACKRQCNIVRNVNNLCVRECNKGKESSDTRDCSSVCSQPMRVPAYCNALDSIFSFAVNQPKSMSIQSDYTKHTEKESTLQVSGSGTTSERVHWSDTTGRTMVYMPVGGMAGAGAPQVESVSTTLGEDVTE
jgi:hypothetical protein